MTKVGLNPLGGNSKLQLQTSYGLSSLKGIRKGILKGTIMGLIKGDTWSLDYSANTCSCLGYTHYSRVATTQGPSRLGALIRDFQL